MTVSQSVHKPGDPFAFRQWCEAHHGPAHSVHPVYVGDPLRGERRMVCPRCVTKLAKDGRIEQIKDQEMWRSTVEFPLQARRSHDPDAQVYPCIVEPRHASDIQVLRLLGYLVEEVRNG